MNLKIASTIAQPNIKLNYPNNPYENILRVCKLLTPPTFCDA